MSKQRKREEYFLNTFIFLGDLTVDKETLEKIFDKENKSVKMKMYLDKPINNDLYKNMRLNR